MGTHLSVARFSGGFTSGGKEWLLMPQYYDMVRLDFVKYYRILGRDKFMEVLRSNPSDDEKLLATFKKLVNPKNKVEPKSMFEDEYQD